MRTLTPVFPPLFVILACVFFWSCEKEDLDWNRQKISFVQIQLDPDPVETTNEIILTATIRDIEDPSLKPPPEPVSQYGHIYSEDFTALQNYRVNETLISAPMIFSKPGGSLFPDLDSSSVKSYNTIIKATALDKSKPYYFMAYIVRPDNKKLIFSSIAPTPFEVPSVSVDTEIPEDAEIIGEMRVRVVGKIKDVSDITISEYGHRLLTSDGAPIDSCAIIPKELITADLDFINEFPFFDIAFPYLIQAYVKYTDINNRVLVEYDDDPAEFTPDSKGGFWVNTAKIRIKSRPQNPADDIPSLEHAVSFVLNGNAYVGLGKTGPGSNDGYNAFFWKFDPNFYYWEKLEAFPFPIGDLDQTNVISFVKMFNNELYAYIGLGFKESDGGNIAFYRTNFNSPWELADDIPVPDFAEAMKNYEGADVASTAMERALAARPLISRTAAYSFSNADNHIIFGGGRGKEFARNKEAEVNCPKEADNDCDPMDWNDFDEDKKIDWGEWIDLNGNGVINAGDTVENEMNEVIGINIDSDASIEVTRKNSEGYFIRVEGKEVTIMPILPSDASTENELFVKRYGSNPTNIKRAEWRDNLVFNMTIDPGEIKLADATKSDLWILESGDGEWKSLKYLYDEEIDGEEGIAFLRYGATSFSIGGKSYLLGGAIDEDAFAQSYEFNNDGSSPETIDVNFNALFGLNFVIDDKVYFGGGEDLDGDVRSLNFKAFTVSEGENNVVGCGLNTLSRGVAFSVGNKGFIGVGRVKEDELTNALWMYIPEK